MNNRVHPSGFFAVPARQRGAALYVALVILLLLAMIGIAGLQVVSMQERMASSYRAANRAFQAAEAVARQAECAVMREINDRVYAPTANCGTVPGQDVVRTGSCHERRDSARLVADWLAANDLGDAPQIWVRDISGCEVGGGMDEPLNTYQITALAVDDPSNPSSHAAIDIIFKW